MDSNHPKLDFDLSIDHPISNTIDGMSPVTDLARNLSVLSTELPDTPCRRISWSTGSTGKMSITDSPLSIDSPMIQENVLRDSKNIMRQRSLHRKYVGRYSSHDKENSLSSPCNGPEESPMSSVLRGTRIPSQENEVGLSLSQESGYDSVVERRSLKSFPSQSSVPSIHSSLFADDEVEDDDGFFALERFVGVDDRDLNLSITMTQLLKEPLKESANKCFGKYSKDDIHIKKTGPTLRRCMSVIERRSSDVSSSSKKIAVVVPIKPRESSEEDDTLGDIGMKVAFKRPEPLDYSRLTPLHSKRRKSSPTISVPNSFSDTNRSPLYRCYSETAATNIMRAVQKIESDPDLVGDGTKQYLLPVISGRHPDLKSITPETMMKLLKGEYDDSVKSFTVVDCRYPYEFDGGHICGARNIYTREDIYTSLLSGKPRAGENDDHNVIIFHCEFSSERAPKLLRYLRSKDREMNEYPYLHHPEVYILDGGYKAFFESFKEFCNPQDYKPMLHKDHSSELRQFRSKSKSWGGDSKIRPKVRSNLKF